jgi:hypothetical protein
MTRMRILSIVVSSSFQEEVPDVKVGVVDTSDKPWMGIATAHVAVPDHVDPRLGAVGTRLAGEDVRVVTMRAFFASESDALRAAFDGVLQQIAWMAAEERGSEVPK